MCEMAVRTRRKKMWIVHFQLIGSFIRYYYYYLVILLWAVGRFYRMCYVLRDRLTIQLTLDFVLTLEATKWEFLVFVQMTKKKNVWTYCFWLIAWFVFRSTCTVTFWRFGTRHWGVMKHLLRRFCSYDWSYPSRRRLARTNSKQNENCNQRSHENRVRLELSQYRDTNCVRRKMHFYGVDSVCDSWPWQNLLLKVIFRGGRDVFWDECEWKIWIVPSTA